VHRGDAQVGYEADEECTCRVVDVLLVQDFLLLPCCVVPLI
jgi:hypothetical protein